MSDVTSFSLFKRSNGYYYHSLRARRTQAVEIHWLFRKADALKVLTNLKELFKKSKPTAISLARFSKVYLEFARATYSKATVDIARIALKHLLAIAGECSLLSVTPPQHIDLYKSKRLQDKVSPVTVNVELRALRTIMNVAVRWQCLEVNPLSKMQHLSIP
jgi:hypothetical protein